MRNEDSALQSVYDLYTGLHSVLQAVYAWKSVATYYKSNHHIHLWQLATKQKERIE